MERHRLSTKQAAFLMGVSEQFIREGLKKGVFPFGYALKNKTRWCYYISPEKFTESTGIEIRREER